MIDARMQAALARLTDNERECLRRRLRQQTAKEMALDLGVSPHAVEKRLKMARAKLGLSSSLEAARLLAASEEYQRTGPQAADLPAASRARQNRFHQSLAWRSLIVIFAAAATLLLVAQFTGNLDQGRVAPLPGPSDVAEIPEPARTPQPAPPKRATLWGTSESIEMVEATPTEMHMTITTTFTVIDADKSGFIEPEETMLMEKGDVVERVIYRRDENGKVEPTGEVRRVSLAQARAEYIAQGDTNDDGRWDFAEYRELEKRNLARLGIPAAWREDIERTYARAD